MWNGCALVAMVKDIEAVLLFSRPADKDRWNLFHRPAPKDYRAECS